MFAANARWLARKLNECSSVTAANRNNLHTVIPFGDPSDCQYMVSD